MPALVALLTGLTAGALWQGGPPGWGDAHWPRGSTIRVWISSDNAPMDGADLVQRAMKTWTDAAAGRFTMQLVAGREIADVRVFFFRLGASYGETIPRVDNGTGFIVEADLGIASEVNADTLTRQIVLYLTALHELGHALGMDHTANFSDIMYLFRRPDDGRRYFGLYRDRVRSSEDIGSASATGVSESDVKVLRELYDR